MQHLPKSKLALGQFDLNLLTALDALLQERHVTHAADRAGLSQPAMSRALGRLRLLLQDDLLVRVGNDLYLTSLASDLVQPVHEVLENIHHILGYRASFDPARDRRVFNLAATDYGIFLLLRPLAAHIEREAPGVSLRIRQLNPDSFNELERAELDMVFGRRPDGSELPGELILRDGWLCAVWEGNPEVGSELTLEKFLELPRLANQVGTGFRTNPEVSLAQALGWSPSNTVTIESWLMLPFLLKGTRFVALLPESIGREIGEREELRFFAPPFKMEPLTLMMSWHPRSEDDPAHVWLRDRLEEIAARFDPEARPAPISWRAPRASRSHNRSG